MTQPMPVETAEEATLERLEAEFLHSDFAPELEPLLPDTEIAGFAAKRPRTTRSPTSGSGCCR